MATKNDLKNVREALYTFVSDEKWKLFEVTKEDVNKATFLMDDEIRITNESGDNFGMYFVNYYEAMELSLQMMAFVEKQTKRKYVLEWYNPAYITAYSQVN